MPVPRLIAAFLTEGYYCDHVGTLDLPPLQADTNRPRRRGSAKEDATATVNGAAAASSSPPTDTTAATSCSSAMPTMAENHPTNPMAAFTILRSLKDLGDEAQMAVYQLPCNTIYFMSQATKDMDVEGIRQSVPKKFLPLYSSAVTPAPLDSYIYQILSFLRSEEEEIIIGFALLAKIATRIPICTLSVARMFLTAMVLASKLRADERTSMQAYATYGGVEVGDMLAMERSFLTALDFDVGVRPEEYADMVYSLRHYCVVAASEGVEWITEVWSALGPRIPVPDLRHLTATPPLVLYPPTATATVAATAVVVDDAPANKNTTNNHNNTTDAAAQQIHLMQGYALDTLEHQQQQQQHNGAITAATAKGLDIAFSELEVGMESQHSHGHTSYNTTANHSSLQSSRWAANGSSNTNTVAVMGMAGENSGGSTNAVNGGVRMTFHH